jgi:cysteine synthase A
VGQYRQPRAHIETTTEGLGRHDARDGFVSAVGSGGTLGGVSDGLKAKRKDNPVAGRRAGRLGYSYFTTGVLKAEGSSITEGIGTGRITRTWRRGGPRLHDPDESVPSASSCSGGLCMGGSTVSTSPAPFGRGE